MSSCQAVRFFVLLTTIQLVNVSPSHIVNFSILELVNSKIQLNMCSFPLFSIFLLEKKSANKVWGCREEIKANIVGQIWYGSVTYDRSMGTASFLIINILQSFEMRYIISIIREFNINSHIRSCDMCSTNGFYPSIFIHFSYFWLFPIFAKKSLSLQKVINWRKKFMPLTEISLIYAWAWALSPFRVS